MCITYRFHHLCGHTHSITTFPCTYAPTPSKLHSLPEDRVVSALGSGPAYRPLKCVSDPAASLQEMRLFPTLCTKCEQLGIIGEWLDRRSGGRFELIRAWNKTHRPEVRKQQTLESEIAELEIFGDRNRSVGFADTAVDSDRTDVAEQQSTTTLVGSPPQPKPLSRSPKIGTAAPSLRSRIEEMKSRLRKRLAELRRE